MVFGRADYYCRMPLKDAIYRHLEDCGLLKGAKVLSYYGHLYQIAERSIFSTLRWWGYSYR